MGDSFSSVRGYFQYCGGCLVQWKITSVQWGDSLSTVEGIQYIGDNVSTCGG